MLMLLHLLLVHLLLHEWILSLLMHRLLHRIRKTACAPLWHLHSRIGLLHLLLLLNKLLTSRTRGHIARIQPRAKPQVHIDKLIRRGVGGLPDVIPSSVIRWDVLAVPTDPGGVSIEEEGKFLEQRSGRRGGQCPCMLSLLRLTGRSLLWLTRRRRSGHVGLILW